MRWSRKRLADFGLDRRGQDRALSGPPRRGRRRRRPDPPGARRAPRARRLRDRERVQGPPVAAGDARRRALPRARPRRPDLPVRTADWIGDARARGRATTRSPSSRAATCAPTARRTSATWRAGPGLPLRDARLGFERHRRGARAGRRAVHARRRAAGRPLAGGAAAGRVRQLQPRLRRPRLRARRRAREARQPRRRDRPPVDHRRRALRRHLVVEAQRRAARGRRSSRSSRSTPEIERAIEAEVADLGRFEGLDATRSA